MNILTISNQTIFIIILVVLLVGAGVYFFFFSKPTGEPADPEKLMENIARYRETTLNDIVSFILVRNQLTPEQIQKQEGYVLEFLQPELEVTTAKIIFNTDIVYTVEIHWDENMVYYTAQYLGEENVIQVKKKDPLKNGMVADYKVLAEFLEEVNNKLYNFYDLPIDELTAELVGLATQVAALQLTDEQKTNLLYQGVHDCYQCLTNKKFRKDKNFILGLNRLLAYLIVNKDKDAFIDFLVSQKEKRPYATVSSTENNEEV